MEEWLFADGPGGWPIHLVHVLEGLYWALTVLFYSLIPWSRSLRSSLVSEAFATFGGICCALAVTRPIALAPLFFRVKGEAMLATLPLSMLALPFVIWICIASFRSSFARHSSQQGANKPPVT